jgi:hypothetical protein
MTNSNPAGTGPARPDIYFVILRQIRKYGERSMGFIRRQEERLAIRLLEWKYQKINQPVPDESELKEQAGKIVDEAHRIARERGHNVISIMKEMVGELKNK